MKFSIFNPSSLISFFSFIKSYTITVAVLFSLLIINPKLYKLPATICNGYFTLGNAILPDFDEEITNTNPPELTSLSKFTCQNLLKLMELNLILYFL